MHGREDIQSTCLQQVRCHDERRARAQLPHRFQAQRHDLQHCVLLVRLVRHPLQTCRIPPVVLAPCRMHDLTPKGGMLLGASRPTDLGARAVMHEGVHQLPQHGRERVRGDQVMARLRIPRVVTLRLA